MRLDTCGTGAIKGDDPYNPTFCGGDDVSLSISPNSVPVKAGGTVTLTGTGSPAGGTYVWTAQAGLTPNGATATFTSGTPGKYTVTCTYTQNSKSATATATVIVVGIKSIQFKLLDVTNKIVYVNGVPEVGNIAAVLKAIPAPDPDDWHGFTPTWGGGAYTMTPSGDTTTVQVYKGLDSGGTPTATLGTSQQSTTLYGAGVIFDTTANPGPFTVEAEPGAAAATAGTLTINQNGEKERTIAIVQGTNYTGADLSLVTGKDATLKATLTFPSPEGGSASRTVKFNWDGPTKTWRYPQ